MKTLTIVIVLTVISCSPKYTASFQNHNRSRGEVKQVTNQTLDLENEIVYSTEKTDNSLLNNDISDEIFMASTSVQAVDIKINQPEVKSSELISLSREEKKSLKKQLKSEIKSSKQDEKKEKRGNKKLNNIAYFGFILSLIGIALGFSFPPLFILLIPSAILSIIGLGSQKKGWAIAGLMVTILIGILYILVASAYG